MKCILICHCLGAAMGSLETCTHVILMTESHKIWSWSLWVCTALLLLSIPYLIWACTNFNFILSPSLSTPPHHIKLFMTMTKMHKR